MEKYCEFCKLLVEYLRHGTGFFSDLPKEIRDQYLDSMNRSSPLRENESNLDKFGPLMPATAICRGHDLCSKHAETIRRDNKERAKKDIDIPTDLSIIGKLRLFDW